MMHVFILVRSLQDAHAELNWELISHLPDSLRMGCLDFSRLSHAHVKVFARGINAPSLQLLLFNQLVKLSYPGDNKELEKRQRKNQLVIISF